MGEGECEPIEPSKKGRHRKKHLYNTILHQMEFYFSDSNLSKDRYLSQLINKDPFIDLNVFLSFNKIRKLNCTPDDIRKAISKSDIIELSDNKEKICRKNPIIIKNNVEDCTIYVENIKADADHEWLSHFFSDFGKVVYVSIPKYKHNKGNKGFAFVEFEKETDAQNALSYFENIGCKMPADTNPDELVSIKTFDASHKTDEESQINDAQTDEKITKKRKLSKQENKPEKKIKIDLSEEIPKQEQALGDNLQKAEETENKKKKKHKKDKKKNYIRDLGLKILSKKDWKKLRNKYLDLQRKKMKEFKQYLQKQKSNVINVTKEKSLKEENNEDEENNHNDSCSILEFVPGVIVKLILPKSSSDVKKVKNEIKSLSPAIKYVDIPLPAGCEEVYVRFSDNENAKQFCENNSIGTKTILEGEEEKEYWQKIKNDRTIKISKNVKKQRGRDKLLKKAEKLRAQHLRFDEGQ